MNVGLLESLERESFVNLPKALRAAEHAVSRNQADESDSADSYDFGQLEKDGQERREQRAGGGGVGEGDRCARSADLECRTDHTWTEAHDDLAHSQFYL